MRKGLYILFTFILLIIIASCTNKPQGSQTTTTTQRATTTSTSTTTTTKTKVTGIILKDTLGTGTITDPYIVTVEVNRSISKEMSVTPNDVALNIKTRLVKVSGQDVSGLSPTDELGLSVSVNNKEVNITGLIVGEHYFELSQDDVKVYVKVRVDLPSIDFNKQLKVLAIGNSFSDDGMGYLYEIAKNYGVEEVVLGVLYIGGAPLSQHANNAQTNANAYTYRKNTNGTWVNLENKSLLYGLQDEAWDIITFQQASGQSGNPSTYEPHLTNLIAYVNQHKTNPYARYYWHLTWAYQANSTHADFPYYNRNQLTMYNAIISTYNSKVQPHSEFSGIIPAGTAIQNIRTSYIGDTVTRDGYHLNYDIGRYTASLTWFKALTNFSIDNITYRPTGVNVLDLPAIKEAVNKAIEKPLEITQSSFTQDPSIPDLSNHTFLNDKLNYVLGYWWSTDSNNLYTTADNSKYFTTHDIRLSKENLPVGSVLILEEGYQYRINFYKSLLGPVTGNTRTDQLISKVVIIDESWWGDYSYVGFNISHVGGSTNITNTYQTVAQKLRIYAAPGAVIPGEEPLPENSSLFSMNFVLGYWFPTSHTINSTAGNSINFVASERRYSKAELPVGTVITIASGYQYRINLYMNLDGDTTNNIRTDQLTQTFVLDEELWGSFQYIAFNVSPIYTTNVSNMVAEVGSKLQVYVPNNDNE